MTLNSRPSSMWEPRLVGREIEKQGDLIQWEGAPQARNKSAAVGRAVSSRCAAD
jgi:hypothetical protein